MKDDFSMLIQNCAKLENDNPEQEKTAAAPETSAVPQSIAAANPSHPIKLMAQKPAEKMKEITDRLEQGIQDLFESDRFKEYLQVMSKFHNYSFNNTLLIAMQKPDATLVAGYNSWKNLFGRQVTRGAKGIKVLAPSPYKVKKEIDKIDPKTQRPMTDKNGKPIKEETEITVPAFKVVSVFDVSQTEGKELPSIGVDELTGNVEQYANFFKATAQASPVPVDFEKLENSTKGYYSQTEKRIAIHEGMSELQNLKTLIHEIAHAKLHDIDLNAPTEKQIDRPDRRTREVQAESIAYAVCQHYGLDTSDYSFSYVAQWSSGRELSELKTSLETIRSTASELIKEIDKYFAELTKDKEHTQEIPENKLTSVKEQSEQKSHATEPSNPSITIKDMQDYGYTWDGMLPLKEETALYLYDKEDMQIFLLHEDGSESIPANPEDIKSHAEKGGIFGVHKEDWNALTEYRTMKKALDGNNAAKEMLQEYGVAEQTENTFTIYQLKDDVPVDYHFRSLEKLQSNGLAVDSTNYEKIYTALLTPNMSLEHIFEKFNFDRPKDFKGHSLSVSDVVVFHQNDKDTAYYTDSIGFVEVPEFLREQKQLTPNKLLTGAYLSPETKNIYYAINEEAAHRANDMNSFSNYKPGSATAEYRQMVDKAVEIGERQKKRVDPMYHEKIDSLVDTYARKLAENMNSSFSIEARVPSILIAGGSNFPVRKKEKQNAARDRNMEDWNEIQGLLDKIRSTGMGGISADDPQAIQKLEAKLEKLQSAQDTMKAVNAYYRKHKTLEGCPNLSAERIEAMKAEMSSQWHIQDKPYPSWALSNNNAEIRRIKGRIAELTKKQETAYAGWEFDGGTVEVNREDNRLQIFFEEKPDEKTRETLKENGFRWSPRAGAWQRQLNDNAIYASERLSCIKPLSGKSPTEIQKETRTAAKTEKKNSIRAQLAQDKESLKNAPKKATEKTKKQDLERS